MSRPHFARDFPRVPALDALVEAFERGDYARVRSEGSRLAESSPQDDVRRAARTLVDRTAADPLAAWLLALAGAVLVVLSAYWIAHGKPPPGGAPEAPQNRAPSEHRP